MKHHASRRTSPVLIVTILAVVMSNASAIGTLFVDQNATGPVHDGSSWCNAFVHVQDALAVATAGTTVKVADGTYKPAAQSRAAVFVLSNGVILEGGYSGCGAPNPDDRNPWINATVLSGDLADNDLDPVNLIDLLSDPSRSENSFRIVVTNGTDSTTRLDGFHVKGATGTTNFVGSGLRADNSSLTVSNCFFSRNSNANRGGGMMTVGGNPVIQRSVFFENYAGGWGAGLRIENSSTTVRNSLFYDNESGTAGGAIHVFGNGGIATSQFIVNCTLAENTSPTGGGFAMLVQSAAVPTSMIRNSVLWANIGGQIGSLGGGSSVSFCDIQGGFAGTGNIDLLPLFASMTDFRLASGSPCIDVGDNAIVTEQADLDGNPRIVDGNDDTVVIVDMGAYEFQGGPDCNGNGISDHLDIANGTSADCNGNAIPDECDILGPAGTALQFDGTGDLVIVPENFELRGGLNGSISAETWVWVEDDVNIHSFVTKFASGCSKTWGLEKHRTDGLAFETEHDCNNYIRFGGIVPVQAWAHVAFTFDGLSNTLVLYINGEVVSVAASDPLFATTVDVLFGRRYIFDPLAFSLIGMLDEIRIWSDVRSQQEIQASMLIKLTGNEEGLLGYWPLDEGQGQQAFDMSPQQNHGMLGTDMSEVGDGFDPQWVRSDVPLIGAAFSLDCNNNGIPDECDLAAGTELDCDSNGIPDFCDIAEDPTLDLDLNGVLDKCEGCGDLDNDLDVDGNDFAILLAAFGHSIGDPEYNADADLDGDGTVTFVDYQQWLQCYRDFAGIPLAPAPQPGMRGDLDADLDVDLGDFASFQDCTANAPAMAFPCILKFDFDGNGTIDVGDVSGFVEVFLGP